MTDKYENDNFRYKIKHIIFYFKLTTPYSRKEMEESLIDLHKSEKELLREKSLYKILVSVLNTQLEESEKMKKQKDQSIKDDSKHSLLSSSMSCNKSTYTLKSKSSILNFRNKQCYYNLEKRIKKMESGIEELAMFKVCKERDSFLLALNKYVCQKL